jgi:hypothetical protein
MNNEEISDNRIRIIIHRLTARFGRQPTEDEVYDFIMGDEETRLKIWNQVAR